jgi:hypothetical protein
MKRINQFLLDHQIRIAENPCISPDFCLDWSGLQSEIERDGVTEFENSRIDTQAGAVSLVCGAMGDHAWKLQPDEPFDGNDPMEHGVELRGSRYYPASFENLIHLKNLVQASDPESTMFPGTQANLSRSTLGIGARFTTLHWPGVFWAMKHLGLGITANQNSIPRELVYDVDKMLDNTLDKVPFPFIGTSVPEGHQGQSVQGMSQGCVIENLKTGFHRCGIPWSFNADHQPIGGKFDEREDDLVAGCLFATYITFDLSPELSRTQVPDSVEARKSWVESNMDRELVAKVRKQVSESGYTLEEDELMSLLCYVWPSMLKMKARDEKYRIAREAAFTTEAGRKYLRELSIDELPGLTTPQTTMIMLSLCELLGMPVNYLAPAFGFQKNMPYPDNAALESLIQQQWEVCKRFGVSIGFHSGSGKSAENYQVMGRVTERNLEIKTSGRYTYEMGVALHASNHEQDQKLWKDWFQFTVELAANGAFSEETTEQEMARSFIADAYVTLKQPLPDDLFANVERCRNHLEKLPADPNLMFWFEYNFLYVLAAEGSSQKSALGHHGPAGYAQRKRFYAISETGRLHYCRNVANYIIFLAENTGLVDAETCAEAIKQLKSYHDYRQFLTAIAGGCLFDSIIDHEEKREI